MTNLPDGSELATPTTARISNLASIVTAVCLVVIFVEVGIWTYRWMRPPAAAAAATPVAPTESAAPEPVVLGTAVPTVAVVDLEGNERRLGAAEGGGASTVYFLLTTTCPGCQDSVGGWNEFYRDNRDGLDIVGISLDPLDKTQQFARDFGVEFPIVVASGRRELTDGLKATHVPQTLTVDGDAIVRHSYLGLFDQLVGLEILDAVHELSTAAGR